MDAGHEQEGQHGQLCEASMGLERITGKLDFPLFHFLAFCISSRLECVDIRIQVAGPKGLIDLAVNTTQKRPSCRRSIILRLASIGSNFWRYLDSCQDRKSVV